MKRVKGDRQRSRQDSHKKPSQSEVIGSDLSEQDDEELPFDEDYLFVRKADQYMFIILAPDGKSWSLIQEAENGPKSGQHWGEIRVCREAMQLIGIKLMTLDLVLDQAENPFDDRLVQAMTDHLAELFEDASMIACELTHTQS